MTYIIYVTYIIYDCMSYFGNILRIKVYYIDNVKDSILIETVFSDAISLNFVLIDFDETVCTEIFTNRLQS